MIKARDFADVSTYWALANEARRVGRPFVAPIHRRAWTRCALADSGQRSVRRWYYPNELSEAGRARRYDSLVAAYVRHRRRSRRPSRAWHQHRMTADTLERELRHARRPESADARGLASPVGHGPRRDEPKSRANPPRKPSSPGGTARSMASRRRWRLAAAGAIVLAGSDIPFATYPGAAFRMSCSISFGKQGSRRDRR